MKVMKGSGGFSIRQKHDAPRRLPPACPALNALLRLLI
jgi:hypothetical protein